ncbi:MAG: phosphatidate cytidylyltransferase, partial [Shewanella sp.]
MLKQRIITALWLVLLVLAGIFLLSPAYLAWVLVPIFLIAAKEWGGLIDPECNVTQWSFTITIGILLTTINYIVPTTAIWNGGYLHPVYQGILGLGAIWWVVATVLVVIYPKAKATWAKSPMLKSMFGQLTLVPCFAALMALESLSLGRDPYFGGTLVLLVMLTVWATDTGAYFAGKNFGKHKLMPNVSPAKTIEGLVGGLAASLLVAAAVMYLSPQQEWPLMVLVTLFTALSSAVGDLSESMFKRAANIKDSGTILPGHGGI